MKMAKITIERKILNGIEHYSIKREYGLCKMDFMAFCVGNGHKNGYYACGINDTGFFDSIEKPFPTIDDFCKEVFQA